MLIGIYALIGISTALSVLEDCTASEIIASVIVGALWPLYITTKLIQRLK